MSSRTSFAYDVNNSCHAADALTLRNHAVQVADADGAEAASPGAIALEIARNDVGCCLTPSSIAAEMRPDLDPAEAAAIYTGAEPWHAQMQLAAYTHCLKIRAVHAH